MWDIMSHIVWQITVYEVVSQSSCQCKLPRRPEITTRNDLDFNGKRLPDFSGNLFAVLLTIKHWQSVFSVEMGGLEPPSKQTIQKLSTRLSCYWLSVMSCQRAGHSKLILCFYFEHFREVDVRSTTWMIPHIPVLSWLKARRDTRHGRT